MNNSIKKCEDSEHGYYTRESDGASGMTVTALADFCGTKQNVITELLNQVRDSDPSSNKLAKSLKPLAGKELRLIVEDERGRLFIVDEVCQAVCEYYAFDARQYVGKDIAIDNFRMIAKAGMRLYIWSQTGYDPNKKAPQPSQSSLVGYWAERQRLFVEKNTIPVGYFSIFEELAKLMWQLEKHGYVIPDYSPVKGSRIVPDISIGRLFCDHMRGKGFAIKGNVKEYKHYYPGWAHSVRANIYPLIWLPDFRIWFEEVWKAERLLKYLGGLDPNSVPPIGKLLGLNEAQCAQQLKQKKSTKKLKAE